jgi:hypothetical protein
MGETEKSFQDELKLMAEICEIVDKIHFFNNESIDIRVELTREKFLYVLNHFREIDRSKTEFNIRIDNVNFNFVLKK